MKSWQKWLFYSWTILFGVPFLMLILLSLVQQWGYPQLLENVGLWHWEAMIWQEMSYLGISLLFSSGIALLCTALGFLMGRSISYHPKSKSLLSLAYYPYLIAPVVLGGMLQYYFIKVGLTGSWLGVGLGQLLFIFPYSVIFFAGFWGNYTKKLEGQAFTLGASFTQTFFKVLLPAAKHWLWLCFFQCFLISWFEYGMTQLIGLSKVPTLTIRIMQFVREANPHLAAVAACLMLIPPLLLLATNRRALLPTTHDQRQQSL